MSSFKDTTSRPCVRKLMSASVVNSPTKEKEEQNSIAKIINFSFRLNPTQHGRVLDLSNKRSLTETSEHDHYEPRQLSKTYEYS